ncbi:glycosyltransferase family 4 protein [Candidatus Gottesmanbacteria bacterium]|nr:glycosyltransferase family 4 protein [Candidatus Gottesmanbacteria bacterium]
MNIAIDVTPLQTGHKDRGVGAYTKLLIEALQKYDKKHSYSFFTRGQKIPKMAELIHYPYFDPFFVTLSFLYHKPTVVTVHDLIPLVFPEHFPAGIRGALKWQYQRARLTRARRVIADSEASKRDIVRIAGILRTQIDVVHLAPSPKFGKVKDEAELARVKKQYHLPESFVLYVGDVNWNKNILGMLEAFSNIKYRAVAKAAMARRRQISNIKFVLVGKAFLEGSNEAQGIARYISNGNLDRDVIRIGGVLSEDLVAIYNLATVYIQPSFYEGFGLPVLEAMASSVPVVSSREASLAEIAGPAIAIDPTKPEDIARGLGEGLTLSHQQRSMLIRAQTLWVQRFSWERVARETVSSYEKAAV